jgi:hypothetical protein
LGDGEDSLAVEDRPLLFGHAAEEAEVVLFDGFLPAASLELAFETVPIEN